jgi:hypothetical protein
MKKVKLRELPNWQPQPGGAYDSNTRFPLGGEAVVREVFPVNRAMVTFRGEFERHSHSYHYKASSEKLASRIHVVVATNMGKRVAELGDCEIEIDE